jgi:hypothetical protein
MRIHGRAVGPEDAETLGNGEGEDAEISGMWKTPLPMCSKEWRLLE